MTGSEAEHTVTAGILQRSSRMAEVEQLTPSHFKEVSARRLFVFAHSYFTKRQGKNALDLSLARSLLEGAADKKAHALLPVIDEYVTLKPISDAEFRDAFARLAAARRKALTKEHATRAVEASLEGNDEQARQAMRRGLLAAEDVEDDRPEDIRSQEQFEAEVAELKKPEVRGESFDVGFGFLTDRTSFRRGHLTVIAGAQKDGKGFIRGTPILTPTGWVAIEDLRTGDAVIGSGGQTTHVTGVFPRPVQPVYRVSFKDGASVTVDGEHLWAVKKRHKRHRDWQIVPTTHLAQTVNQAWRIPICGPVEFVPQSQNLPLDPYLLGVILGDGSCAEDGSTSFTPGDRTVPSLVQKVLPPGVILRERPLTVGRPESQRTWAFKKDPSLLRSEKNAVARAVISLGLAGHRSWEKFIPGPYLLATVSERLSLLQGLIDTDGEIGQGGRPSCVFSSSSKVLADGVAYLVRSLGGVARTNVRAITGYDYKGERRQGRPSYRVCLSLPSGFVPTRAFPERFPRHLSRKMVRTIHSVELTGEAETICIAVEAADHLYVADQFIVTHNTQLAKSFSYNACMRSGARVLFTSLEMDKREMRILFVCHHASTLDPKGVPWCNILDRTATKEDKRLYARALIDFRVDEGAGDDPDEVRQKGGGAVFIWAPRRRPTMDSYGQRIRGMKKDQQIDIAVGDYLDLFLPSTTKRDHRLELTEKCYEAKEVAQEADIWHLACHHISRAGREAAEKRTPRHYLSRDLGESAGVERSSSQVVWIYSDQELRADRVARVGMSDVREGESLTEGVEIFADFRNAYLAELGEGE